MLGVSLIIIAAAIVYMVETYISTYYTIEYMHGTSLFLILLAKYGTPVLFLLLCAYIAYRKFLKKQKAAASAASERPTSKEELYTNKIQTAVKTKSVFSEQADQMLYQVRRFGQKMAVAYSMTQDSKTSGEQAKCLTLLESAERIFYDRLDDAIRSASMFDETEYKAFCQGSISFGNKEEAQKKKEIDVQAADAMIDLSPCISIYMQAGFFNSYDIDDALAYYMDLHKDMQYLKIKKGATVEDKVLLLTALETNQCRYVKQVKPPFVSAKAKMSLSMRLGTVFTPDEYVQARGDIDIHTNDHKVIYASGLADVVKNNTVYCIKFISSLAHKHFLQCACSMIALGLPYGVVWNVKSNLMYSVKIKDKDALIDAILKCITKRAYNGADYYTCRKGFVQDTASIIDRWTDDGYAEESTTITSGDGIAIIKQGSRYFVMDGARRNTLNDNFGLGFADVKDACLAYAKSCELQKTVDHDSPYSEVEFWLDQNKAFEEYMTQVSHEIEQHKEGPYAKYKSFATPAVRKMLAEKGLTITFPEKVLIKVWKMRRVEDAMYQKIEEAKKQNSSNVPLDEAFFDSELVDSVEGNTENTKAKAKPQKESALPFSKYGVDEKKSYRVVKSDELSKPNQPRYVVVETATDKVLDNANGYGYLSYQAAWKGYSYKSKHHLDGTKKPMSKSAKEQAKKKAAFFSTDSEQLSFG